MDNNSPQTFGDGYTDIMPFTCSCGEVQDMNCLLCTQSSPSPMSVNRIIRKADLKRSIEYLQNAHTEFLAAQERITVSMDQL
jgi:hypothetical protein